jgi:hypothetical protein
MGKGMVDQEFEIYRMLDRIQFDNCTLRDSIEERLKDVIYAATPEEEDESAYQMQRVINTMQQALNAAIELRYTTQNSDLRLLMESYLSMLATRDVRNQGLLAAIVHHIAQAYDIDEQDVQDGFEHMRLNVDLNDLSNSVYAHVMRFMTVNKHRRVQ